MHISLNDPNGAMPKDGCQGCQVNTLLSHSRCERVAESYRTKLKSIPAFFAALQRLSCALFRRAMCCPGLRADGNIHGEFPSIRAASIRLLSDVRSSVLRAAGDLPHPDLKLPALQIDIAFRQRRDFLGAHSLKYHQPPQIMQLRVLYRSREVQFLLCRADNVDSYSIGVRGNLHPAQWILARPAL